MSSDIAVTSISEPADAKRQHSREKRLVRQQADGLRKIIKDEDSRSWLFGVMIQYPFDRPTYEPGMPFDVASYNSGLQQFAVAMIGELKGLGDEGVALGLYHKWEAEHSE